MASLSERFKSNGDRPAFIPVVSRTVRGIFRWLIGFFTFTEEDRSKAGIYHNGEGRGG